jgi:hypothetical protein
MLSVGLIAPVIEAHSHWLLLSAKRSPGFVAVNTYAVHRLSGQQVLPRSASLSNM